MSVINIRKAQREGARLVIGFAGISGSGKTYSALELALGLAGGDASKVGMIDAENKRGSLYADDFPGILIGDLYAPFSPDRYAEAVLEFQKAGVEVLVIDSASHEWEGLGGCEEIAAKGRGPDGWKVAKAAHKRFMNTLLTCNMHVIMCFRAREKVDFSNPRAPVNLGLQPITEKNVMYEMTASLMMWNQGREQQVVKCPADLLPILGREKDYITRKDGEALRAWVNGAQQLNPEVERYRNELRTVTQKGTEAVRKAWQEVPRHIRKELGDAFVAELKKAAEDFDKLKGGPRGAAPGSVARLNDDAPADDEPDETPPPPADDVADDQGADDDDPF